MQKNYIKYFRSILFLFILITSHLCFAQQVENQISKVQNPSDITFIHHSNSPKILLIDSWELQIYNNEDIQKVSIPFFIKDKFIENVTFKRSFIIPDNISISTMRLWILGLHGNAVIKLNDYLLMEHVDISTSFKIDINKKFLIEKKNVLEIKLTIPTQDVNHLLLRFPLLFKQYRPLGIARAIYLEFLPDFYFEDVAIKFFNNKLLFNYKTIIKKKLQSPGKTLRIEEKVISAEGVLIHKRFEYIDYKESEKEFHREITINKPRLWTLDAPSRYKIHLSIHTLASTPFQVQKTFGLRNIQVKNNQIYLNNAPIEIKGVNYRSDYSSANNNNFIKLNNLQSDFLRIKELGFNSIRFVNHVPHPYVARIADSLGLLLFIDNGFWRLPEKNYSDDRIFQIAKTTLKEILDVFGNYACVAAIGLGHDIPIESANARKFVMILDKYLKEKFNILSYISSIPLDFNIGNKITDINLVFNYQDPTNIFTHIGDKRRVSTSLLIPGNVGFPSIGENPDNVTLEEHKRQYQKFTNFFNKYDSEKLFNGYFIEAYRDWEGVLPSVVANHNENNTVIYPYGLYDKQNHARLIFQFFTKYLSNEKIEFQYNYTLKRNNFFSIIVFFFTIIFFLIYKRNFRFRENLKRSLQYPYGFWVDLRDRRIISIFNSTVIGITIAIIISSFIASILYANKNSIWLDEFISVFISNFVLKSYYLSVINSALNLFLSIFIFVFGTQILFSLLLRIAGIFSKEKIKLRQTYAIVNWSGAPLLYFIPVSLFAYNLTVANILFPEIIWLFFIFYIWYNYRFGNGIRVLFQMQPVKILLLIILTYLLLIVSFYFTLKSNTQSIEYLDILLKARDLYN
jgi:hypothetical protein